MSLELDTKTIADTTHFITLDGHSLGYGLSKEDLDIVLPWFEMSLTKIHAIIREGFIQSLKSAGHNPSSTPTESVSDGGGA